MRATASSDSIKLKNHMKSGMIRWMIILENIWFSLPGLVPISSDVPYSWDDKGGKGAQNHSIVFYKYMLT